MRPHMRMDARSYAEKGSLAERGCAEVPPTRHVQPWAGTEYEWKGRIEKWVNSRNPDRLGNQVIYRVSFLF